MSLLPYFVDPIMDYEPYPNRLFDQHFGVGLFNDDLNRHISSLIGLSTPLRSGYLRSLRHLQPQDSGVSSMQNTKDEFKVSLDVQQFKPEDIKVKVSDNFITIEGKHEERMDEHGFVSREFTRKYRLPSNVKTDKITSNMSSDGLLQIIAPKEVKAIKEKEREVKIVQTNQPAIKDNKEKTEKMET